MSTTTTSLLKKNPATWIAAVKNFCSHINMLFWVTVIIPTALSILYFGFFASDVYISEAKFVIRNANQHQTQEKLLSQSNISEDIYSVHDFILSRDALQKINHQLDLNKIFGNRNIDIFNRFAGLSWEGNHSFEALYNYYQKHVSINQDASSPTMLLRVRAFNAEDAYFINEKLLKISETFINQLNEHTRQHLIQAATHELNIAEKKAKAAALATSNYLSQKNSMEPTHQPTDSKQLTFERDQANKKLFIAWTSLGQVYNNVQHQEVYLERIAEPNKPDIASEPHRLRNIFATLLLGLTFYGILTLFVANIREHID